MFEQDSPPGTCTDPSITAARAGDEARDAPLAAGARGAREHDRLALAEAALQHVEDHLVVDDGVRVVHPHRVRAVVEHDLRVRYPLAEVRLPRGSREGWAGGGCGGRTLKVSTPRSINASSLSWYHFLAAGFVTSTTPRPGCHRSHLASNIYAGTTQGEKECVLPRCAVSALDQVTLPHRLLEYGGELRDVRVDLRR